MIILKSSREIELMRQAGKITAAARALAGAMVAPGVTTREIDKEVKRFIRSNGAEPSFLGYDIGFGGYPASVFSYPMVLVVSGEIEVEIDAAPGLATHADLARARESLLREIMMGALALPLTADTGEALLTSSGRPIHAVYELERSGSVLAGAQARLEQAEAGMRAYTQARLREAMGALSAEMCARIEAHDRDAAAHPTHLAAVRK